MDIFKVITKRRTVRKYTNKPLPEKIIKKIVEAARWAPSAHNLQPWNFVILTKAKHKEILNEILINPPQEIYSGVRIMIKKMSVLIRESPVILLAFNSCTFSQKAKQFGRLYYSVAYQSEIQSIAASIQNMHLASTALGIGFAWYTIPLLLRRKINKVFLKKGDLVALITMGFPAGKNVVPQRKKLKDIMAHYKKYEKL